MSVVNPEKKVTIPSLLSRARKGEKLVCLTAYDAMIAKLIDDAGVDMILVGDSAANVVHGHKTTLPISMDVMVAHAAAVSRGSTRALRIADMPFLSYQPSVEVAITNAGRFLKEGFAEAVKLEGGIEIADTAKRLVELGIPVMGHIGLTPQSIHRLGGAKVQGKQERSRQYLYESAEALESAGCFSLVLELIESETAQEITARMTNLFTIGIGSGIHCDAQVLVTNDMLGLRDPSFKPRFLREYAHLNEAISNAVSTFTQDVRSGNYPGVSESFNRDQAASSESKS